MSKSLMKVNGKDVGNPNAYLTINLADDKNEVRGFGQPVTRNKAKEMANDYFKDVEAAWEIVKEIETNPNYADLKNKAEFQQLRSLLDPDTQTVSGVFGKELILQILSGRNCEGIRYIAGKDELKNTIILIGVEEVISEVNGEPRVQSRMVRNRNAGKQPLDSEDDPVNGEVHEESMTIAQVLANIPLHGNPSDVLFGTY